MSRSDTGIRGVHTAPIAACASTLSCLLTLWLVRTDPGPELPTLAGSDGSSPVVQELIELREEVVAQIRSLRGQPLEPVERQAIDVERVPESEQFQALLQRLDQILMTLRYTAPGSASAPLPRQVETDWNAIASISQQSKGDDQAALKSVLLMTPAEVLARFGFPTEVSFNNGGMYWSYYRLQPDGSPELEMGLRIAAGYVVSGSF